jgi:hypothetical protein
VPTLLFSKLKALAPGRFFRTAWLCLFLITSYNCWAEDSLLLQRSIPITANYLSTDPLGQIYLVRANNSLLRLNSQGDSNGVFNEVKKGKISFIDATNPLRVLIYFSNFNQIVVLNNMLTQKSTLKLNQIGLINVACIANSADGRIWVYDPVSSILTKIDEHLNIIQETNLRTVEQNPVKPTTMVEHDRWVYLAGKEEGIRKFDQFGFYKNTLHLEVDEMQIFNQTLIYYQKQLLHAYDMQSLREQVLHIPEPESVMQVRMERKGIYVLRKDRLDIYLLSEKQE